MTPASPSPVIDHLGPYPEPPTPDAVRAYATRRADLACDRARRTKDPFDVSVAVFWVAQIEGSVKSAVAREEAEKRLRRVERTGAE